MYLTWNGMTTLIRGAAIAAAAAVPVGYAAAFQKELKSIQTVWNFEQNAAGVPIVRTAREINAELNRVSDSIRRLSRETGFGLKESGEAMYEIMQANISSPKLAEYLLKMSQMSAVAGRATVKESADALLSILWSYYDVNKAIDAQTGEVTQSFKDSFGTMTDQLFAAVQAGRMSLAEFAQSLGKNLELS